MIGSSTVPGPHESAGHAGRSGGGDDGEAEGGGDGEAEGGGDGASQCEAKASC